MNEPKAGARVKGTIQTGKAVRGFLRGKTRWGQFIVDFPRWNGNPGQMPRHQWLLDEVEPDDEAVDE